MKSILVLALTLLSSSLYADTYRLKDNLCGEIDPFVIGDACVLTLENDQEEIVLITDEDFLYQNELEISKGDFFELDKTYITLASKERAREYRDILNYHLSFRRSSKFFTLDLKDALVYKPVAHAQVQFTCQAQAAGSGFLDAFITISGTLQSDQGFSSLNELNFSYKLLDGDNVWSQGQTSFASLLNNLNYRPRVYVGMEQFNFYFSDRVQHGYGEFDIILPVTEMMTVKKEFQAHVIMTAIDDHHGDTATLSCQTL